MSSEKVYIITDGLVGKSAAVNKCEFLEKEGIKLEHVKGLIKDILGNNTYSKSPAFIVSVGSWNFTASYLGWDVSDKFTVEESAEKIKGALNDFKGILKSLKSFSKSRQCKVILASLIPLPKEQNCDDAKGKRGFLVDMISRCFIRGEELVEDFNGGKSLTPIIAKYLVKSNRRKYLTGQLKIKTECYNADDIPDYSAQQKMRDQLVRHSRRI